MMIYNIIIHNKKNHLITEKLQITEIMNEKLLNVIMLKILMLLKLHFMFFMQKYNII